jgi:hypothetical protein
VSTPDGSRISSHRRSQPGGGWNTWDVPTQSAALSDDVSLPNAFGLTWIADHRRECFPRSLSGHPSSYGTGDRDGKPGGSNETSTFLRQHQSAPMAHFSHLSAGPQVGNLIVEMDGY